MKTQRFSRAGFTLIEIMIVVAIIGLLATIAIPNFIRARTKSQQNACIHNLRQIDGAIQQWALESKQTATALVAPDDISPYLGRSTADIDKVVCPTAGSLSSNFVTSYAIRAVDTPPICIIGRALTHPHTLR